MLLVLQLFEGLLVSRLRPSHPGQLVCELAKLVLVAQLLDLPLEPEYPGVQGLHVPERLRELLRLHL